MNKLLLSFLLLPALCWGDTSYYLDRVVYEACNDAGCRVVDTQNVEGFAVVEDTGAFTPIEAIDAEAKACPAECNLDGTPDFFASPVPDCTCMTPIDAYIIATSYERGGQIYQFDYAITLHVLRRGSVATESSDPAFIVRLEGGEALLYREVELDEATE